MKTENRCDSREREREREPHFKPKKYSFVKQFNIYK